MLDPRRCKRLVVYGGSFDPPHRGHLEMPFAAARAVRADGVLYIPAGQPPHKPDRRMTEGRHRVAMLRLALSDRDDAAISTYELDRHGTSYTVETLEHLRSELGDGVELRLLIGADMAAMFHDWHQPERVIELAEPLVMPRAPYDADRLAAELHDERWRDRFVDVPKIHVASKDIRRLIEDGRTDDPLLREDLHPEVLAYILQHGLYTE